MMDSSVGIDVTSKLTVLDASEPQTSMTKLSASDNRDIYDESGHLKVRRSNREIRKPKFDDEIVDSAATAKIMSRKRPSVERSHPSPEIADNSAEKAQLMGKVKLGKRQWRPSESNTAAASSDCKSFRKSLGKPVGQMPSVIFADKKRRERSASKEARTKELAAFAVLQTTSLATALTESSKKWTPLDDIALITAVTRVRSIAAVHGAVRFSRSFTRAEIEERWYELLYDEVASNIAKRRIADLSVETINAVQSRTVFTVEEEELLSTVPSTTSGSDLNVFEQLLERNKEVFHHARTASVLQQHWLEMKNWDLLQDQKKASSRVLDYAEIEQSLVWNGGSDCQTDFEEMRLCKRAALMERAWLHWEKVHVETIGGISDDSQMGDGVWGVLKGRVVRYLLRGKNILIGRNTRIHSVDINLALEGPVTSISRKQAVLKLTRDEGMKSVEVFLSNIGKHPIYVDGKTLLNGDKTRLFSNGLVEISQIRLQLFIADNAGKSSTDNQQTGTKLVPTEQQSFATSSSS